MIAPAAGRPLRITALITDSFGGYGGIARFNVDLLTALSLSRQVERVHVLPRLPVETAPGALPEFLVFDRRATAGKVAFGRRVLSHAAKGPKSDLVICGHINLLSLAWPLARAQGARLALVIYGIDAWTPTLSPLVNALSRRIDALVSISRFTSERFERWSSQPGRELSILPTCVDLGRFVPEPRDPSLAARYGIAGDAPVLLTVGRLASAERYKGLDEVLEAMPDLLVHRPALKYLIVGDGDDRERLAAKAAALGIGASVVFAGRVPEEEKVAHYALASAFAMPGTGEGFGIVFLEAVACGVPTLGSLVDGSREALLDGRLGRLVDPRDRAAILPALEAILAETRPLQRHPEVATFGWDAFRSRVDAWCAGHRSLAAGSVRTARAIPSPPR